MQEVKFDVSNKYLDIFSRESINVIDFSVIQIIYILNVYFVSSVYTKTKA